MLTETHDHEEIIERVAALDIGKAEPMCCSRIPDPGRPGRRLQEVAPYSTMTRSLLGMADHLTSLGVTRVVMEATSDTGNRCSTCWKPPGSIPGWSMPRDVKHLPGRPKTDCEDHAVPPRAAA